MENAGLAVFALLIVMASAAPYNIEILPLTPVITKQLKSDLRLTCTTGAIIKDYTLLWFDNNGTEIKHMDVPEISVTTTADACHLKILILENFHQGTYTCKMMQNGNVLMHTSRQINITANYSAHKENQFLTLNETGMIKCIAKFGTETAIKWFRNGEEMEYGKSHIFHVDGLILPNVANSDAGYYLCEHRKDAANYFSANDVNIKIYEVPVFKEKLSDKVAFEGTTFSALCKADGVPEPSYKFFLNGSVLKSDQRITVEEANGRLFFLTLKREDEGELSCIAENAAGSVLSKGYLSVSYPPVITSFSSVHVSIGKDATLSCIVDAKPLPTIAIKRNMEDVNALVIDSGLAVTLVLKSVTKREAGSYFCLADSDVGSDNKDANVNVLFKPEAVPGQRILWSSYVHQTRNVTCLVEANPPVTFEWYFGGKRVVNDHIFTIFNSDFSSHLQMYIPHADQSWIYGQGYRNPSKIICRATNSEGTVDINMEFTRSSGPYTLQNVTYDIYPCQVDFHVSMPLDDGGEPVTEIRTWITLDDDTYSLDFPWANTVRINKLQPMTLYEIRISGVNVIGDGEDLVYDITTADTSIPFPVEVDSVKCYTESDSIFIAWEEPIDACLPVLGYQIKYRKVETSSGDKALEEWKEEMITNVSALSAHIYYLSSDSFYQLEVYVQNSKGWSKPSSLFVIKTKECDNCSSVAMILGIIFGIILLFLFIVDLSCCVTRQWGVLHFLIKKMPKPSNMSSNRNLFNQDKLLLRSTFGETLPSFKSQEEFVALTPTEDHSDNQRTTLSSSDSQVSSSNIDSERQNWATFPDSFYHNGRFSSHSITSSNRYFICSPLIVIGFLLCILSR